MSKESEVPQRKRSRVPSPQQLAVLSSLLAGAGAHGYELMKLTGLGPGTLYGLLKKLYDEGFLQRESRVVGGRNRVSYQLTPAGARYAERMLVEGEYEQALKGWEAP